MLHGVVVHGEVGKMRRRWAIFQPALAGRKARIGGELAACDGFGDAAATRGIVRLAVVGPLNLFFGERPRLTFGRLSCSGNVARGGSRNGWRRPDHLLLGVTFRTRGVSIGDPVDRGCIQPASRNTLLVKGVLDRSGRLIRASVRGVAESHIT